MVPRRCTAGSCTQERCWEAILALHSQHPRQQQQISLLARGVKLPARHAGLVDLAGATAYLLQWVAGLLSLQANPANVTTLVHDSNRLNELVN